MRHRSHKRYGKKEEFDEDEKTEDRPVIPQKQEIFNVGSTLRPYQRVLVTGGAGFIGSHICDVLLKRGCEVICMDNLHSGNKRNIQHNLSNKMFEFLRHDVTLPIKLVVDRIYHLACPASPVFYQLDGIYTLDTLYMGTRNMLQLARDTKARLLISSTSEVYGNPLVHPQTEEYWGNVNPIGIRSCYDEGKRVAETLCIEFRRKGTDIRIARIFNTYGERMLENDGRVVSNFITQALSGKKLTIYGTGDQTRSFCYVSDTVEALLRLMEGEHNGPINIGNPEEYSVKQLAEMVTKRIPAEIEYMPLPTDDPIKRKPDITLAKKFLKWEPTIPIEDGLNKTIKYFKSIRT